MNEFIITFRESLEAALIVGIIFVILDKNGNHSQKKRVWLSTLLAVIASAVLGIVIHTSIEEVGDAATKELIEGMLMYITAALLFYVIFWMAKNLASRHAIQQQTDAALSGGKKWGIFFLVFFAIVREGFETALFLVASTGMDQSFSYVGFFAGILLAVIIGYLIVVQGKKIQLKPFFKYTSLLLVFFAAGMIAHGTHEIHEYMEHKEHAEEYATEQVETVNEDCAELMEKVEKDDATESAEEEEDEYAFNIFPMRSGEEKPGSMYVLNKDCNVYVHVLNSEGAVGSFLKGLFGYNSSPVWAEVILWILSLIFGLMVWRRAYK